MISLPSGKPNSDEPTGLLLVTMDIEPGHEDEFNRWYWEEHFPERMACPGFQWGGRFQAVEGSPQYLALYLLDSPNVLQSPEYRSIAGDSAWTAKLRPHFRHLVRNVYETIPSSAPQSPAP